MSLSIALNHALSGLKATSQQAELASTNVSNALTPGYARREVILEEAIAGGQSAGVRVLGIERASAASLDAKRIADGDAAYASALSEAATRLADQTGEPGAAGALATSASDMINAFALAAETPESRAFLDQAARAAGSYATTVTRIAVEVQVLRNEADASIANQVDSINASLVSIQSLNAEIQTRSLKGEDTSALEDERARLVEVVSSMIPVRVIRRENDVVALYAENGGQLLDGRLAEITFAPTASFSAGQTIDNGALSGLMVDGRDIPIGRDDQGGLYDGGSLAAAFQLRDSILTDAADDLDALAEDAILRVQGLAADPTLAAGDAGLFTDQGVAYDPADRLGVALRLELNAAVDPAAGGESSRLRDGVAAAATGDTGNAAVLIGLLDAFEASRAAPVGSDLSGARTFAGFAEEASTLYLSRAATRADAAAFETGKATALADAVATEQSVDSDQQLAQLLVVERAFAANARVVNVVDEMLENLLTL
ncbi:MAG: flagellar hook-associated protein FlgK [Pseudomonadota bacterium]